MIDWRIVPQIKMWKQLKRRVHLLVFVAFHYSSPSAHQQVDTESNVHLSKGVIRTQIWLTKQFLSPLSIPEKRRHIKYSLTSKERLPFNLYYYWVLTVVHCGALNTQSVRCFQKRHDSASFNRSRVRLERRLWKLKSQSGTWLLLDFWLKVDFKVNSTFSRLNPTLNRPHLGGRELTLSPSQGHSFKGWYISKWVCLTGGFWVKKENIFHSFRARTLWFKLEDMFKLIVAPQGIEKVKIQ